jgi:anthranilate/para-aminobenzoate synthase component I
VRPIAIRELDPPPSRELVFASPEPGAALLEGWSDDGSWQILLPWPEETRELEAESILSWPMFVRDLEPETPADDPFPAAPFLGGWVGFIGYETAATVEEVQPRSERSPEPAAFFARHSAGILVDPRGRAFLFAEEAGIDDYSRLIGTLAWCDDVSHGEPHHRESVIDSLAGGRFSNAVDLIRESIARGDVYQVNLTRRFSVEGVCDPARLYAAMTGSLPPRSSAFLRGDGWTIVSASPEVLLRHDRRIGVADSRPIKGTIRRHGDDRSEIAELMASEKDASEHLMIVDLVRNDLGKISPPGAVSVSEFRSVRTLEHVHHLESIVRAEQLGDLSTAEILAALSPAGSITGAPKRAAVHMIRELEPVPRGVYCGSIGFIDRRGRAEWSVAIRTAVATEREVRYHAGGGIVWDSSSEAEHAETLAKSAAFLEFFGVGA